MIIIRASHIARQNKIGFDYLGMHSIVKPSLSLVRGKFFYKKILAIFEKRNDP